MASPPSKKSRPIKAIDAYVAGDEKAKKKVKFNLTVVGMQYRLSNRQFQQLDELIEEEGGVPCNLEREPTNEVDAKAVKVITLDPARKVFNNWHVGYVRRPANEPLFDLLRRGAVVKMCMLVYLDAERGEGELEVALIPPAQ